MKKIFLASPLSLSMLVVANPVITKTILTCTPAPANGFVAELRQ